MRWGKQEEVSSMSWFVCVVSQRTQHSALALGLCLYLQSLRCPLGLCLHPPSLRCPLMLSCSFQPGWVHPAGHCMNLCSLLPVLLLLFPGALPGSPLTPASAHGQVLGEKQLSATAKSGAVFGAAWIFPEFSHLSHAPWPFSSQCISAQWTAKGGAKGDDGQKWCAVNCCTAAVCLGIHFLRFLLIFLEFFLQVQEGLQQVKPGQVRRAALAAGSAGNAGWELYCFLLWGFRRCDGLVGETWSSTSARFGPRTWGGVGNVFFFFSSLLLWLLQEREANKGNNCSLWPLQRPLAVEADLCLGSACFGARTDGEKNAIKGSVPIMVLFLPPLCMSALKTSEKKGSIWKKYGILST